MIDVIQFRVAGSVCFHIAHVALVSRGCVGPGMRLVGGIKMRACGTGISCAAIAEFMYMKAVLTGRQARDLCVDLHAIGDRRECDGAARLYCLRWDAAPQWPFDDVEDFTAGVCASAIKPANDRKIRPINKARNVFIILICISQSVFTQAASN